MIRLLLLACLWSLPAAARAGAEKDPVDAWLSTAPASGASAEASTATASGTAKSEIVDPVLARPRLPQVTRAAASQGRPGSGLKLKALIAGFKGWSQLNTYEKLSQLPEHINNAKDGHGI